MILVKQIAFVGQNHYFLCTQPKSMSGFKIHNININFEPGDPSRYNPCLELQEKEQIDYWVFFRGEFAPQSVLEQLQGKKINISTEPIKREDIERQYLTANKPFFIEHFKQFDYFTHYDVTEIPTLRANGFDVDSDFLLPVDTDTYRPYPKMKKLWDLVFFGRGTARRQMIMGPVKKDFEVLHIDNGVYDKEAVRLYNMSKIGLNLHVGAFKQQQHRIFNMMACGLPIISDELTHTCWLRKEDEIYFDFVKELDCRKLYSLVLDRLDGISSGPSLEMRGRIMRRIAEKQFDARTNWAKLIEKVDAKEMGK